MLKRSGSESADLLCHSSEHGPGMFSARRLAILRHLPALIHRSSLHATALSNDFGAIFLLLPELESHPLFFYLRV